MNDNSRTPDFYLSNEVPCPYLPDRKERRIFTVVNDDRAGSPLYDILVRHGFRRMSHMLYRTHCKGCTSCYSVRVRVPEFSPSRSQRRSINRNRDLIRAVEGPVADIDQHALFCKYLEARHAGAMNEADYGCYRELVESSPVNTILVKYFLREQESGEQRLAAVAITDCLDDGLSMVYAFFDPEFGRRSLGTFMILDHVGLCRERGLKRLYLGFWVPGSSSMNYKIRFMPLDILVGKTWKTCSSAASQPVPGA